MNERPAEILSQGDDIADSAAIVCTHVARDGLPIRLARRDEPVHDVDTGWQFHCDVHDHAGDDETPARRGEVQDIMRAYWEKEIAAGRIPNGADLNRAAGKQPKYLLGKKRASEWRTELPAEFTDHATGDQQEQTTRGESTSPVPAELAE